MTPRVSLDAFPFHLHPEVLGVAVALVAVYWYGIVRLGPDLAPAGTPRVTRRQIAWFVTGVVSYLVVEMWPFHDVAEQSLYSVHMVQHLVLMFVMPPAILKAFPSWLLRHLIGSIMPVLRRLTRPLIALALFNIVLAWLHAPSVVSGMLGATWYHLMAHVLVITTSFLMWWPVIGPVADLPKLEPPLAMGYLFLQSLVPLIPASFMTFAQEPLYRVYEGTDRLWGLSVLDDQRIAGLIMKLGGGAILWLAITVIFFRWAGAEDRARAARRVTVSAP